MSTCGSCSKDQPHPGDPSTLEDGWVEKWSNSKKRHYWANNVTKKSQFERPTKRTSVKRTADAASTDNNDPNPCSGCTATSVCPGDPANFDNAWVEKWSKSKGEGKKEKKKNTELGGEVGGV